MTLTVDGTQKNTVENPTPVKNKQKKTRYGVLGVILLVPIIVIVLSVVLTRLNINLSELVLHGYKEVVPNVEGESETRSFSAFETNLLPILSRPSQINIKGLNISANIVDLGVAEDGTMENPTDWTKAGWYRESAQPGEDRNIVINGHYDDTSGKPAAFHRLNDVKDGDIVEIQDNYGRIFNYKVVESTYVDINDPARLEVLKDVRGKATLTLITCGGVWLPEEGYSKRLIVSAELVEN